jgi:hypothetical protein
MKKQLKGTLIAASVASLFACNSTEQSKKVEPDPNAKIQCGGINECKGKSDCHAIDGSHSCGTENACQGKGWKSVTAKECEEKGGKVIAKK